MEKVDLTINIMVLVTFLLWFVDTNQPILTYVYEGWDSMIESMRTIVMENECAQYETLT